MIASKQSNVMIFFPIISINTYLLKKKENSNINFMNFWASMKKFTIVSCVNNYKLKAYLWYLM